MSNYYPHKTPMPVPAVLESMGSEELYKHLTTKHRLDSKLKAPEMRRLLELMLVGHLSASWLNKFVRTKHDTIMGPAGKVFVPFTTYNLSSFCVGARKFRPANYLITKQKLGVLIQAADGSGLTVNQNDWVHAVVKDTSLLPMDLRKWPPQWVAVYFPRRGFGRGDRHDISTTVKNARQVNHDPSKAQRRRIQEQLQKKPHLENNTFSLNE